MSYVSGMNQVCSTPDIVQQLFDMVDDKQEGKSFNLLTHSKWLVSVEQLLSCYSSSVVIPIRDMN